LASIIMSVRRKKETERGRKRQKETERDRKRQSETKRGRNTSIVGNITN
jgi:hypothetical protein